MDFEETRAENDALLLTKIDRIAAGTDVDALDPFARAYLGLFLAIDSNIPPRERIALLANPRLAAAVLAGFEAALTHLQLPRPRAIGEAYARGDTLAEGFIVLAGVDTISQRGMGAVREIGADMLAAALCFHYANGTYHEDVWLGELLRTRPDLCAQALLAFWAPLIEGHSDALPGLGELLEDRALHAVLRGVLAEVLVQWTGCKWRTQRALLLAALEHLDRDELLSIVRNRLAAGARGDVRKQTFWLTSAFMLDPDSYAATLHRFCGRSKEKILPLLDFVTAALDRHVGVALALPAEAIADLLHVIAPRFAPQEDRYGQLCENTQKVLALFARLGAMPASQRAKAVERLRSVRVMGIYSDVLDQLAASTAEHERISSQTVID